MDEEIKNYAETLYEGVLFESGKTARDELRDAAASRSAASNLPLSGFDLQRRMEIQNRHVERCVIARLESYERAYEESGRTPSDQELDSILQECRDVRRLQVQHTLKSLNQLIGANQGTTAPMPTLASLEASSAHGMDRVLSGWKQWKAKAKLKRSSSRPVEREKQKDVLLPVLSRAEFDSDLAALCPKATAAAPLSLIFMDLDKFKSINDGPGGHAAGDRALKAFAEAVLCGSHSKGTTYRYGGDELCVLLVNHSLDEAQVVAERIRREVKGVRTDELPKGLSTSIGVACLPESAEAREQLCPLADEAMYVSKKAGGDRVTKSGAQSPQADSVDSGNGKPSKEEIKKQLAGFLKEARTIQNGIAYNNSASLYEKTAWEKRVEECLSTNLDESYIVQFQVPSREVNDCPQGIMMGMMPAWRELTARMWMLSDFISKLRE